MRLDVPSNPERLGVTGHERSVFVAPVGGSPRVPLGFVLQAEHELDHAGEPTCARTAAATAARGTWRQGGGVRSGGMDLPAGPRAPAAWQTVAWMVRPGAFLSRTHAQFGDPVTIRTYWTEEPMVLFSGPDAVRDVFGLDPAIAPAGQSWEFRARSPGLIRSCCSTARSICASAG